MREGQQTGRMRRPLLDVSSKVSISPEAAWDITARLIGERRRGEVIETDPRAHEALRQLGGKAAYDAVASAPDRIGARFIRVYAVLSEIADLMRELEELISAPGAQGEADANA